MPIGTVATYCRGKVVTAGGRDWFRFARRSGPRSAHHLAASRTAIAPLPLHLPPGKRQPRGLASRVDGAQRVVTGSRPPVTTRARVQAAPPAIPRHGGRATRPDIAARDLPPQSSCRARTPGQAPRSDSGGRRASPDSATPWLQQRMPGIRNLWRSRRHGEGSPFDRACVCVREAHRAASWTGQKQVQCAVGNVSRQSKKLPFRAPLASSVGICPGF